MRHLNITNFAQELRRTDSARTRHAAIVVLGKSLRRGDRFQTAWDAVGGANGIAALMAEFSVREVRTICRLLGRTSSAEKARPERRAAIEELVRLLYEEPRDERPLREYYQDIVPGCSPEVIKEWEAKWDAEWSPLQRRRLFFGHHELNEAKFLEDVFSPSTKHVTFRTEKLLFSSNLEFSERILLTLATKGGHVRIPTDFMSDFAMPLLERLLKKRYDQETRYKYLDLVMECIRNHSNALAHQLNLLSGGLIQYLIQRWIKAPPESKPQLKLLLIELIKLLPTNEHPPTLDSLLDAILVPRKTTPETRYELLRLLLWHLKCYKIDIEGETKAGLDRLRFLPADKKWPTSLFFSIDKYNAIRLFENLATLYPLGDFLAPETPYGTQTVMSQRKSIDGPVYGDVEIVRASLLRQMDRKTRDQPWSERVRTLVQDRRKKAQQSREHQGRFFWAKSALNLCVAASDLEMLSDTLLWARRFNKDTQTIIQLYDSEVLQTRELEALLGVIPRESDDTPISTTTTPRLIKADIQVTKQILVDLVETAAMISQEPGVQYYHLNTMLQLPRLVVEWRLKNVNSYTKLVDSAPSSDTDLDVAEVLWKPTIDTLVRIEAVVCKPTSEALDSMLGTNTADYLLQELPPSEGSMLSELSRFFIAQMKTQLQPERVRARTNYVVRAARRIAHSDQPWLACPFIWELVMDGDDNSSWHRQLLTKGFLSSLPAKAAKDLVHTMGNAMKEKMREQNALPRSIDSASTPSAPAIKVTTVKMMAQLLQGNAFIDATSSCDILVGLLSEARHIDAQITLLDSLMSTMEEQTCPPQIRTRILDAIESHVVPVAAQLSERRVLTDEDWEMAALGDGKLPEASEETPLIAILIDRAHKAKVDLEVKLRLTKLILYALDESAANNSRWMSLFLSKNQLSLNANEILPVAPIGLRSSISFFLVWPNYTPASLLRVMLAMVMINICPTPGVAAITAAVKANRDLVDSNAGRHWLAQFDNPGVAVFRLGLEEAAVALQRPAKEMESKLEGDEGVTFQMLREFVLVVANQLVSIGDVRALNALVMKLCCQRFNGRENWESWRLNCIPLVKDIVASVEATRLRGSDLGRSNKSLLMLNTFQLRVQALPTPFLFSQDPTGPEEITEFASGILELVNQLGKRKGPYHDDFSYLKAEVLKAPKADFVRLALELGKMTPSDGLVLADYLRLEVAGDLLIEANDPSDEGVVGDAREMVHSWETDSDENVRTMGFRAGEKLRVQGKRSWFNTAATK